MSFWHNNSFIDFDISINFYLMLSNKYHHYGIIQTKLQRQIATAPNWALSIWVAHTRLSASISWRDHRRRQVYSIKRRALSRGFLFLSFRVSVSSLNLHWKLHSKFTCASNTLKQQPILTTRYYSCGMRNLVWYFRFTRKCKYTVNWTPCTTCCQTRTPNTRHPCLIPYCT